MKTKTQTIAIDLKQIPEIFVPITTYKATKHFKLIEKLVAQKKIEVYKYYKDGKCMEKCTAVYVHKAQAGLAIDKAQAGLTDKSGRTKTIKIMPQARPDDSEKLLKDILAELKNISARLPKERTPTNLFK